MFTHIHNNLLHNAHHFSLPQIVVYSKSGKYVHFYLTQILKLCVIHCIDILEKKRAGEGRALVLGLQLPKSVVLRIFPSEAISYILSNANAKWSPRSCLGWWWIPRGSQECALQEQTGGCCGTDFFPCYWGKKIVYEQEKWLYTLKGAVLKAEPRCSLWKGFKLFQFLKWKHFYLKCGLGYSIRDVK